MLLNEIASVTDITTELNNRKETRDQEARDKRSKERLIKMKERRKDKKNPDEVGELRRSKLSQSDQFRDIARQLRSKD